MKKQDGTLLQVKYEDLILLDKNPSAFWDEVKVVGKSAFSGYKKLERIELPEGIEKIEECAFSGCDKLKEVKLPSTLNQVDETAFNGCKSLNKIDFMGFKFEYSPRYFLSIYDIVENKDKLESMSKAIYRLKSVGVMIPSFCMTKESMDEYLYTNEYKYLKNILKMIPEECKEYNLKELYKLTKVMGILENNNVTIFNNDKELPINGVAYTMLQGAIKKGLLNLKELYVDFQSLPNGKCNKEFVKFMLNKTNLEELLSYNKNHRGFFSKVYDWFEERESLVISEESFGFRNVPREENNRYKIQTYKTMESGVDKIKWNTPTVELFIKEFASNKFNGMVDERSREIGTYLSEFSLYEQKHFDKALEIDKERVESGVKDHLTKEIVKEDIIDSLEDYKRRISELRKEVVNELKETLKTQIDTSSQIFTYEMLAKSDKVNFAIGFLTNCCAKLYGVGAGAQRAMIIHPDMQPLVIKNIKGEIVCFGIIYVNREEGYAVVNDFELGDMQSDNKVREEIYTKAMQGVDAFVTQYNKENANNPIKIVTCGLSPSQNVTINDFIEKNREFKILDAPNLGEFGYTGQLSRHPGDWHKKQYVIWEMDKKDGAKR